MTRPEKLSLIVIALSVATPLLSVADPGPADIATARRLFAEARAAEDQEDWSTAESRLRGAIAIKETAGLRFHVAYCQERRGMLVEAMIDYDRAAELAAGKEEELSRQVSMKRETLHKKVPTVTLIPQPSLPDVSVSVDGHPFPTYMGKAIPQNPGAHHVVVAAPGHQPFEADVKLAEGDVLVMTANLQPAASSSLTAAPPPASASAETAPPTSSGSGRAYLLIGEAAITAVSLGIGIGYTIAAHSSDTDIDRVRATLMFPGPNSCNPPQGDDKRICADLQEAGERSKQQRFFSQMGFIGAGVGAAAFAATWILWPARSSTQAILPFVSPQASGLFVTGQF